MVVTKILLNWHNICHCGVEYLIGQVNAKQRYTHKILRRTLCASVWLGHLFLFLARDCPKCNHQIPATSTFDLALVLMLMLMRTIICNWYRLHIRLYSISVRALDTLIVRHDNENENCYFVASRWIVQWAQQQRHTNNATRTKWMLHQRPIHPSRFALKSSFTIFWSPEAGWARPAFTNNW